jgi:hypothetical protein
MVVLVCGDRRWRDADAIRRELAALLPLGISLVMHGGCSGADAVAGLVAKELGIPVRVFPADWSRHGRAAGPIRNRRMLAEANPSVVLAFHVDLGRSRGTADMVRRTVAAGVPVLDGRRREPAPTCRRMAMRVRWLPDQGIVEIEDDGGSFRQLPAEAAPRQARTPAERDLLAAAFAAPGAWCAARSPGKNDEPMANQAKDGDERRRDALKQLIRLSEDLGLYDDDEPPPRS